jgi:hypothetical protein
LDYPNLEVYRSMPRLLVASYMGGDSLADSAGDRLGDALGSADVEGFVRESNLFLDKIPHDDYDGAIRQYVEGANPKIDFGEWMYRSSSLSLLIGAGLDVEAEARRRLGRPDLAISAGKLVWVVELKVFRGRGDGRKAAEAALGQIEERGCGDRHAARKRVLLGLAVSCSRGAVTAWRSRLIEPGTAPLVTT